MGAHPTKLGVIALGSITALVLIARSFFAGGDPPLEPPEVLVEKVTSAPAVEEQVQAARDLVRHGNAAREQVYVALQRHVVRDPAVVAPLLQATAKVRDHRSLATVLELLEHPDPQVRGRAGAAAKAILGADFGFRAHDPPERRAKTVAKIRRDAQNSQQRIGEFYADSESSL